MGETVKLFLTLIWAHILAIAYVVAVRLLEISPEQTPTGFAALMVAMWAWLRAGEAKRGEP